MRMHQVEVDDEVFAFVKSHAEPLVDTFNSSLRRQLPLSTATQEMKLAPFAADAPSFPSGTPRALRQILEVVLLVLGGSHTRPSATHVVAKRHGVATPTVLDKYARQLGLATNQFDRLLEQPGLKDFKQLLRSKFPKHTDVVASFLP